MIPAGENQIPTRSDKHVCALGASRAVFNMTPFRGMFQDNASALIRPSASCKTGKYNRNSALHLRFFEEGEAVGGMLMPERKGPGFTL